MNSDAVNSDAVIWDAVVVGAGAAGLIAAEQSALRGRTTLLLERNPQPGIKILMSGGTRCNLTHATDARGIVEAFGPSGRFLHSSLAALSPADLVSLFHEEGVETKVEETGKVFPASDDANDILAALVRRLQRSNAQLALNERVTQIVRLDSTANPVPHSSRAEQVRFRIVSDRRELQAENVLITTGGKSYPGCGTSGDGYAWLASLGHTILTPRPALTPVTTNADWVRQLRGITIPDVRVRVVGAQLPGEAAASKKLSRHLADRRGSLLFTHFGLSGPVILDVSRVISGHSQPQTLVLICDFLPSLTSEQLEQHFLSQLAADGKRSVTSLIPSEIPRRLGESLLQLADVAGELRAAELSRIQRRRILSQFKETRIPISGTMGFRKAEVTAGGVSLSEVDSRTMQSKLVPGLYLAGEILDLDGPIGGFNFQAAFSTGLLAGRSI